MRQQLYSWSFQNNGELSLSWNLDYTLSNHYYQLAPKDALLEALSQIPPHTHLVQLCSQSAHGLYKGLPFGKGTFPTSVFPLHTAHIRVLSEVASVALDIISRSCGDAGAGLLTAITTSFASMNTRDLETMSGRNNCRQIFETSGYSSGTGCIMHSDFWKSVSIKNIVRSQRTIESLLDP